MYTDNRGERKTGKTPKTNPKPPCTINKKQNERATETKKQHNKG